MKLNDEKTFPYDMLDDVLTEETDYPTQAETDFDEAAMSNPAIPICPAANLTSMTSWEDAGGLGPNQLGVICLVAIIGASAVWYTLPLDTVLRLLPNQTQALVAPSLPDVETQAEDANPEEKVDEAPLRITKIRATPRSAVKENAGAEPISKLPNALEDTSQTDEPENAKAEQTADEDTGYRGNEEGEDIAALRLQLTEDRARELILANKLVLAVRLADGQELAILPMGQHLSAANVAPWNDEAEPFGRRQLPIVKSSYPNLDREVRLAVLKHKSALVKIVKMVLRFPAATDAEIVSAQIETARKLQVLFGDKSPSDTSLVMTGCWFDKTFSIASVEDNGRTIWSANKGC